MGQTPCKCEAGHTHSTIDEVKECHRQTIRKSQYECPQGHYHQNENEVTKCIENEKSKRREEMKNNHVTYRCIDPRGNAIEYNGSIEHAPPLFRDDSMLAIEELQTHS